MDTDRLHELLVLAGTMNFSRAAEKLFITQSTLSKHIQELESELGIAIFERDSHSVRLTNQGRLFVNDATAISKEYEAMIRHLRMTPASPKDSVALYCAQSSMGMNLQKFIRSFAEKYPQHTVNVTVFPDAPLNDVRPDCDFVISPYEYHGPAGMTRLTPVLKEAASLAESLTSASMRPFSSLRDLENRTLLVPYGDEMFCSYSYARQLAERFTGGRIFSHPTDNLETALFMVQQQRGCCILPRHADAKRYADIIFRNISQDEFMFSSFLYGREMPRSNAASAFYEELMSATASTA